MSTIAALQVEHPRVAWMFAETRQLAEEWAYRWLAAAARVDSPRAVPLLDERALGEAPIAYEGRPRLLDAAARRSRLLDAANAGTEWTSRAAARSCGVTQVTAAADLAALASEGLLRVIGAGTKRRYVARLP